MNPPLTSGYTGREKIICIHCDSEMERISLMSQTFIVHAGKNPAEKPSLQQRTLSFSIRLTVLPLPNLVVKHIKLD